MALVLNATFPGRNMLRSVMLIPWGMAPVAVGILWSWIFDGSYGTLNALLFDLGLTHEPIAWMANGSTAFNLVALVHVWNQAPFTALLVLAALSRCPRTCIAPHGSMGRADRAFLQDHAALARPMLLLIMLLTSINSIMAFDLFWIMTKGGPGSATTVFSWMGYSYAFQLSKFGEGAAILYILTIVCLLLAWVYLKLFTATERRPARASRPGCLPAAPASRADGRSTGCQAAGVPPTSLLSGRDAAHRRARSGSRPPRSYLPLVVRAVPLARADEPVAFCRPRRTPPSLVPNVADPGELPLRPVPGGVGQGSVQATRVPYAIWNSLVVAVCVTAINLILGSLAGYAYARHGKGRLMNGSLWALMMTRMTPSLALILPFFIVFRSVGLIDTRTALVIAYCSLILPLSTWMMKGYFENLPPNLEKAALVDGCTPFQAIWKIILPVARPGIVAAGIFCFLVSWNEFVFALILTGSPKAQTIPVIIAGFLVQLRFYDYGPMFAASVLAVIPPVVIAFAFQRYLVRGMLSAPSRARTEGFGWPVSR